MESNYVFEPRIVTYYRSECGNCQTRIAEELAYRARCAKQWAMYEEVMPMWLFECAYDAEFETRTSKPAKQNPFTWELPIDCQSKRAIDRKLEALSAYLR